MYRLPYRHTPSKITKYVKVIYRTALKFGNDFCKETSIHGFSHIAASRRHWTERVLWVCVVAAAAWGAVSVSLGQWQRYNENPTVVTLEKDFRSWRFSLPAFTACELNRTDPIGLAEAIKKRWGVDPGEEKYSYYRKFVETVANSDLYHLNGFEEFKDDRSLDVDLYQLAVDVMPVYEVKDTWSVPVSPKWTPVMTESGGCYSTNSLAIFDEAIVKPSPNITAMFPMTCKYSSQSCYMIFELNSPTDLYAHSPYDVVDVTAPASRIILSLNRVTELSVMETRAGRGVRGLRPLRRGCRYTDEPTTSGKQVYSTDTCRRSCRNRLAIKLCGCKPFYNFYEEGRLCDVRGMFCLAQHSLKLSHINGMDCACSPQCVDSVFKDLSTVDQYW